MTHSDIPISVLDTQTPPVQTGDSDLYSMPIDPDFDWSLSFDDQVLEPNEWAASIYVSSNSSKDQSAPELATWCYWATRSDSFQSVAGIATVGGSVVQTTHQSSFVLLVTQSLRAIPNMMLRRETFPWFIHAPSTRHQSLQTALADELVTCMSIAQLFALRTSDTHKSLWQMVSIELDRLSNQKYSMTMQQLLAAVQACMVYSIMCIIDHSADSHQASKPLLATLNDLYVHFKRRHALGDNNRTTIGDTNSDTDWSEWVFAESQKRLMYLWFLIGCVVCIKSGVPCDPSQSYRNLPLPCIKSLWEASTRDTWAAEVESSRILQSSGLSTLGDLLDTQASASSMSSALKLDKWNAGADTLGSLLNLTSLILD
ncbi:hypothetical protein MBLNU457_2214t1 [Dothideomycetes sp. NU457]